MDEKKAIIYQEILERYSKIIWTHKIQLCQADIYLKRDKRLLNSLNVISVLLSASTITDILEWLPESFVRPIAVITPLILTCLITVYKAKNFEKKAGENERFAALLHDLSNRYAGILSNIKANIYSDKKIIEKRTQLEEFENIIYMGIVPFTSKKAVKLASIALKEKQESVTTEEEIDTIISKSLRL